MERGCEVDTGALPSELRKLLDHALTEPPAALASSPRGADLTEYSIAIDGPGKRRELRFHDTTLPAKLAPLIAHLAATSKPLPLK